jgi:threonine dehydratase
MLDAEAVDQAAERLRGVSVVTPLQLNQRLSDATDARIWVKREDLQAVRSYKIRGAYNLMSQLTPDERAAGVVCASAGNHGQGVAMSCALLGIRGRIFVPSTTPRQKRQRMIDLGGDAVELVIVGDTYDDAADAANRECERTGATIVPAFDDPRTIAGGGTCAREIVEQLGKAPDLLVVPVGGAGMISGCLVWMSEHAPRTKVIAAEPAGAASLAAALEAGRPVTLSRMDTFVDGAAVKRVGNLTFSLCARHRPVTVSVPEGRICSEMLAMYQVDGVITEPAGALAAAALGLIGIQPDTDVVVLVSGGNNDVSRYAEIVERSLVYEGRKYYFLVNFPQEPGALRRFLDEVLGPDDDITHFEYVKRSNREVGPALVGIEVPGPDDFVRLLQRMDHSPITAEVIDPNSPMYRFLF